MTKHQQSPTGSWSPLHVFFEGDLPSQLADLRSLQSDFTNARNCAGAYLNADKLHGGDEASMKVVREALWRSAVISYRRGFTTGKAHLKSQGKRLKVPEHWKELLSPEQLEAHTQVLDLANRHIAHRASDREHMKVSAMLFPPPMPRAVAGIIVLSLDLAQPVPDLVERLGQLCTILLKILNDRSEELGNIFRKHVESQDLDNLYENAEADLAMLKVQEPPAK